MELANSGDAQARRLIRDSGRHIGAARATAVNLLNPAVVVVAGDMVGADDIVAGLRETRGRQIVPSMRGDRAGLIGSAVMALDHVLSSGAIDSATR